MRESILGERANPARRDAWLGGNATAHWLEKGLNRILVALFSLVLASSIVFLIPKSPLRRMSNLDFEKSGLAPTYLMSSRSRAGRCRMLDRRESTMRRGDERIGGSSARCDRIPQRDAGPNASTSDASPAAGWIVHAGGARPGRAQETTLFIPIYAVGDWTFPYFYEFVRKREESLALPRIAWTQLFVDRLYAGLHLRVELPVRLARKGVGEDSYQDTDTSGNGGQILRSLLTVGADTPPMLNTEHGGKTFEIRVEQGNVPTPAALAWLATLAGGGAESQATTAESPPFDPEDLESLRAGYEAYADSLTLAIGMEGAFHESGAWLRAQLPQHRTAASRVGWRGIEL